MADQRPPPPTLKRQDTPRISHTVSIINIGIIISSQDQGSTSHTKKISGFIRRVAPDRFSVIILGEEEEGDGGPKSWPAVHVLVLCSSRPNFPAQLAAEYVDLTNPPIILSDFNLDRVTSDRRIFYDLLQAHRVRDVLDRLPLRGYANRDGEEDGQKDSAVVVVKRREHIDVDGTIILKPCMERPADSADDDFRVYYPMSSGGGCKHLTTGRFLPDVNEPRDDRSYIYEELVDADESAKNAVVRRYGKRDRLMNVAYSVIPGLGRSGAIPDYADDDEVTFDSDLTRQERKFFVVTTASLPWMTGTAVNPLLRAAYLARDRPKGSVTLVVPWLGVEEDRRKLYAKYDFNDPSDQEAHVREWLRCKANMPEEADSETGIQILWYEARYHPTFMSIFSVCDICKLIPDDDADVCVLEEPEHLNWFRAEGDPWTKKFTHTVGIVHTNYKAYAGAQVGGFIAAPIIGEMSSLMVRAYCNKVIKLSPVLQTFSPEKEVVCNVHGVRSEFIAEGERRAKAALEMTQKRNGSNATTSENVCVYFVGKILWAKGLDKLLYLQDFYSKTIGSYFDIDIYGDGPELDEIKRAYLGRRKARNEESHAAGNSAFEFEVPRSISEFRRTPIPARFLGRRDHAELGVGDHYKVFVNPSITEVLCTTTAEALAMGKFAIIPAHPSNSFFMQFQNCLPFVNKLEFAANLTWALTHEPEPLSAEDTHQFTWEAATDRFINVSAITMREERIRAKAQKTKIDKRIAAFHNSISKGKRGDVVRTIVGAGPVARQSGDSFRESVRRRASATFESVSTAVPDYLLWVFLALVLLFALWWANLMPDPAGSEL